MADWGDKKQVGIMLSPEALALSDGLAERRGEKGRPKWTRSDLLEALLWEEGKRAKIEPDGKDVKRHAATLNGRTGKRAR